MPNIIHIVQYNVTTNTKYISNNINISIFIRFSSSGDLSVDD